MKNTKKISMWILWLSLLIWTTMATDNQICTMEYAPVCGEQQVQCVTTPCDPIKQTYGNKCMANAANAKVLYEGECKKEYNISTKAWLVSWAYDNEVTMYDNVAGFRFDDLVSREEAAKMIITTIEKSWTDERMIKQSADKCTRNDKDKINNSLYDSVFKSCAKWLFYGSNGKFMPNKSLTDTELMTVMNRISQFVPKLADFMMRALFAAPQDTPLTRWELLWSLHSLYSIIQNDDSSNTNTTTWDVESNTWDVEFNSGTVSTWVVLSWTYHLWSYNNTGINNTWITLGFDNDRIYAKICNNINGSYTTSGANIKLWVLMSTKMACMDEQISTLENSFGAITSLNYVLNTGSLVTTDGSWNVWTWIKNS